VAAGTGDDSVGKSRRCWFLTGSEASPAPCRASEKHWRLERIRLNQQQPSSSSVPQQGFQSRAATWDSPVIEGGRAIATPSSRA